MSKTRKPEETKCNHVLLIDEDQIDNFINERIIVSTNFAKTVTVKQSAISALDYLKNLAAKNEVFPELIFLDLNMPVMDGFGFLAELDKLPEITKELQNTKIIVLSSSISPADIDRSSANPYVYKYLNKPLTDKYLSAINI